MARNAFPDDWHLLSRLKFRQLHLITALDELRNLHRAAERVHLTQPAATRLLGQIERALGLALFERSARGMMPTAAGAALIHGAREILGALARTGEELTAIEDGATGSVNIGVLIAATPVLLPRAIARFKTARPDITVTVLEANHEQLVGALRSGSLDLVVGRMIGDARAAGMDFRPLHAEPMRVVARAGHPLVRKRRALPTLAALAGETWIWPSRDTPYRPLLEAAFRRLGVEPPRRLVESVSVLVNATLLAETDFLGVMPQKVAEHFVLQGTLAILPLELPAPTGPIGLINRAGQAMTPAMRDFVEVLAGVATELGD